MWRGRQSRKFQKGHLNIRQEISNVTINVSENLTQKKMENFCYYSYWVQRKTFPALPISLWCLENLKQISQTLVTNRGESILLVNDAETNSVYFATKSNLENLADQKKMFVDRAFLNIIPNFLPSARNQKWILSSSHIFTLAQ